MNTYEIRILDTMVALLLFQLRFPGFDVALIRYPPSNLFISRLIPMLGNILISLFFRALIVTGRALHVSSLSLGLVQR